ncbi:MAG: polyprenyl synthetase family protein, partial [Actinomycetota bacterium]
LRPALVIFGASFGRALAPEKVVALAMATELIHTATLVHDDILDGAELRRGWPALAAKYGSRTSMAGGDYLFSSAFGILSGARSARAISMLTRASLDLSLGELAQRQRTGDFSLSAASYIERCRLKTSSLFSVACMMGALLSGCSPETVKAMEEFGLRLGLAFQIADDILDFSGESAELGKRAGADLRDGTVTLPLLIALARDSTLIERLSGELTESGIDAICRKVQATGALDEAGRQAREQVSRAIEALEAASAELDIAPLALVAGMAADRKK